MEDKENKKEEENEEVELHTGDCFHCGSKGTLKYTISEYNGHKHGYCTACGIKFME